MSRFAGLLGIIVLLALAYLFSLNRRAIRFKTVIWGLGLQFVFAFIVIYAEWGQRVMTHAGDAVNKLLSYALPDRRLYSAIWAFRADPYRESALSPAGSFDGRLHFCISGFADHHLHIRLLCCFVTWGSCSALSKEWHGP